MPSIDRRDPAKSTKPANGRRASDTATATIAYRMLRFHLAGKPSRIANSRSSRR